MLEAPIPLPGVKAPEDPTRPEQPVNLRSSSGFEGMAISKNGKYLYPSLERALNGDDIRRHYIYEFDTEAGEYTNERWEYRADLPVPPEQEHAIGDMTALDNLWNRAPEQERYSFAFQGRLQILDHILVTAGLRTKVGDFRYAHFGNDYHEREDPTDGHHVSDHDPPVLTLSK